MEKSLHIAAEKCTGCLQCELACSFEKEGVFNPSRSRIKVFLFHDEAKFVPYTCTQCAEAWCQQTCPVDAIYSESANNAKIVNEAACVGCKVCTIACPFGTINYNVSSGKVEKCDLCDGNPACARLCPTGAISFIDTEATGYDKMKSWAAKSVSQVA